MDRARFLKEIQNQPDRLIPRCVITQGSGKQMVIDNADTGGQSDKSSDANKLTLCPPPRPAQHIALVLAGWSREAIEKFFQTDAWETGEEDLPSAYRFCPMSKAESMGCVVVVTTVIGTSRPISYTPGCCLAFLLQSLRSTASPAYWRACAVVLVEF